MAIFIVIANGEDIKRVVEEVIEQHNRCKISDDAWFVDSSCATSKDLSEMLHRPECNGSFIVTPVTSYYGFHQQHVWEWLSSKGA